MISYTSGDLLAEDVEALVNAVNCQGVMGRGIALQFRKAFPANFKAYAAACELGDVKPGRMFVHETGRPGNPRFIINFPTKRHWRDGSRIGDIQTGLDALVEAIRERTVRSIALPALGCGLGGLDWSQVRPLIENAFSRLGDVEVRVFAPQDQADP